MLILADLNNGTAKVPDIERYTNPIIDELEHQV